MLVFVHNHTTSGAWHCFVGESGRGKHHIFLTSTTNRRSLLFLVLCITEKRRAANLAKLELSITPEEWSDLLSRLWKQTQATNYRRILRHPATLESSALPGWFIVLNTKPLVFFKVMWGISKLLVLITASDLLVVQVSACVRQGFWGVTTSLHRASDPPTSSYRRVQLLLQNQNTHLSSAPPYLPYQKLSSDTLYLPTYHYSHPITPHTQWPTFLLYSPLPPLSWLSQWIGSKEESLNLRQLRPWRL